VGRLRAPNNDAVQHLFSGPRLPFTGAYFGSIALTLYFSIGVSIDPFPTSAPQPWFEMPDPCIIRRHPRYNPWQASCLNWHTSFVRFCAKPKASFANYRVRVTVAASQHLVNAYCGYRADGMSDLVLGQLLPYGIDGLALRGAVWRKQNRGLDERVALVVSPNMT